MARIIDGEKQNLVGPQVCKWRKARKLSQQTLSERLETQAIYICRGSISRMEKQQRTVTDMELAGLARVLEISVEDLFPDEKQ